MTTELVELADKWQDEAAGTWGEMPEHAMLQRCSDELRALASRAGGHPDTVRMDWLADRNNIIGNVQLPAVCVMNNLHDMRAAIDEAMRLDPEIAAVIAAAPEPVAVGS